MTINSEQIQALKAQMKRKRRDWTSGVMRTCDYCGQHKYTVTEDDGSAICAPCCDAAHVASLENIAETMLAERDADKALIAEQRQAITKLEISCDRNYVEGMKTGWNYCDAGNSDGFNTCVEQREKDIRTASITLVVGE